MLLAKQVHGIDDFAYDLVGSYWTHSAIYVGDGKVVEAVSSGTPTVVETDLQSGDWSLGNAKTLDWEVVRVTSASLETASVCGRVRRE